MGFQELLDKGKNPIQSVSQNGLNFTAYPSAMKEAKSRRKLLRVNCLNCNATQDALHFACAQCNKPLYANMGEDEIASVIQEIDGLEAALAEIEKPAEKYANPYVHMDKAFKHYQVLRGFAYLPEMPNYLDRVLEILIPLRIRVLRKTANANLVLTAVLLLFPLVTFVAGLHWTLGAILVLPAIVWIFVTLRAFNDLKRAQLHLSKISSK